MSGNRLVEALGRRGWGLAIICVLYSRSAWAGGGGDDDGHAVILNIAISLVAGSFVAYVLHLLKQPLLLGYILAGVAIGPVGFGLISDHIEIVTVSEIGLILLLFMIGLEIDVRAMIRAGSKVIVPGLLQFPICVGLAYLVFGLLEEAGVFLGAGTYPRLYVAIGVSISSTMIVVKLLSDKMEMDTLPGRITVGILVFQDVWAIIVLAIQPNLNNPEILGIAKTFATGALLVGVALAASRYVLPTVFRLAAQVPELILVLALGWCFLVALVAAHPRVGLSMEMGALIAGVSLATFPYNLDVVAKATSIRDFFITLFFVALGMQIPLPSVPVVATALGIIAVALGVRAVGIFGVLYSLKSGLRLSNVVAINLGQVSEFSLVILSLGIGFGHIEGDTLAYLIWVFATLAVVSTYGVTYSHPLQKFLVKLQRLVRMPDIQDDVATVDAGRQHTVVLLGFYHIASAFLEHLRRHRPELLEELLVVDFNPVVRQQLAAIGVDYVYGDIGNPDTLHHAKIHEAKVVLCTIQDAFLKGTSNRKMITQLKRVAPHSAILVTAESSAQAIDLYEAGADYVLQASVEAGDHVAQVLEKGLSDGLHELRGEARSRLEAVQQEVTV